MSMHVDPSKITVAAVPVSLSQWDATIAPVLHKIEAHAYSVASHATAIAAVMVILELRPKWQTKAGEGLADAIQTVRNALGKLELAQQAYRAKPLMLDAAE
jgi:hypothetical protein